jgi:DNA-binding response OmpR family regulator
MPDTVLVCDDQAPLRALVRAALDESDYRIVEAADGGEALELARSVRPDLILLDLMMPVRSGLEVLSELRADPDLVDTRVLVVSARTQASDYEAAARAGADRYLAKPFSIHELVALVDEMLRTRQ